MRRGAKTAPDWDRFRDDFHSGAVLCRAPRPGQPRSLEGFIDRMDKVARKRLASFQEQTQGMQLLRFVNVAVVLAMSEMIQDGQDISGYL